MSKVNVTLDCICLRWQHKDGRLDSLSSARELCLAPLDSIREFVQIACRDTMITLIDRGDERSELHFEMFDGTKI